MASIMEPLSSLTAFCRKMLRVSLRLVFMEQAISAASSPSEMRLAVAKGCGSAVPFSGRIEQNRAQSCLFKGWSKFRASLQELCLEIRVLEGSGRTKERQGNSRPAARSAPGEPRRDCKGEARNSAYAPRALRTN